MREPVRLIITDSGLGGLSICAGIARARAGIGAATHITYVNAWPEQGRGYNDIPEMAGRAAVFERALHAMLRLSPDEILIACNTLSIVYEFTELQKAAPVPIHGIIDAGVNQFFEALSADPGASMVLLGTRTTILSGVHQHRLAQRGISPDRIGAVACHGLAAAIERGPRSVATATLIDDCTTRASALVPPGSSVYVGLCCTHYTLVSDDICRALEAKIHRPVVPLDPNVRMLSEAVLSMNADTARGDVTVEVISKVTLDSSRDSVAELLESVSPDTAAALRGYTHVPDLF
jgi:glutamate racemase